MRRVPHNGSASHPEHGDTIMIRHGTYVLAVLFLTGCAMTAPVECNSFDPELVGEYESMQAARVVWHDHGSRVSMVCKEM